VPPPPFAGDLETLPSRYDADMLDSILPAMLLIRRPLLLLRGRTTWRWRGDELRRTERRRASVLEVADGPPCQPKIVPSTRSGACSAQNSFTEEAP
jgi:hypothetical protein